MIYIDVHVKLRLQSLSVPPPHILLVDHELGRTPLEKNFKKSGNLFLAMGLYFKGSGGKCRFFILFYTFHTKYHFFPLNKSNKRLEKIPNFLEKFFFSKIIWG